MSLGEKILKLVSGEGSVQSLSLDKNTQKAVIMVFIISITAIFINSMIKSGSNGGHIVPLEAKYRAIFILIVLVAMFVVLFICLAA